MATITGTLAATLDPTAPHADPTTPAPGSLEALMAFLRRTAPNGERDVGTYRDPEGRTALHWAVAHRSMPLAETLMGAPYDCNPVTADDFGTTPLLSACAAAAPTAFVERLLLAATHQPAPPPAPDAEDAPAAPVVAGSSPSIADADAVARLRAFINQADSQGSTPLMAAASRGNLATVKLLLHGPASFVGAAGSPGGAAVVAPILFADPRVQNVRGQTALHRAVTKGEMALCETLISAVRKYFPTEVKKFVNAADKNGDTALHYASLEENREIGEFLLRNGATRELRNKGGKEFWQL